MLVNGLRCKRALFPVGRTFPWITWIAKGMMGPHHNPEVVSLGGLLLVSKHSKLAAVVFNVNAAYPLLVERQRDVRMLSKMRTIVRLIEPVTKILFLEGLRQ